MTTNKKTILIIEDNGDIRESIAEILHLSGYDVIQADNGKGGIEIAVTNLPDIILCDIMMPELDGYGVLYMLGKNEVTSNIPFIFLTAKAERNDIRKGMNLGADDYLVKPFDNLELLSAIEARFLKKERADDSYMGGSVLGALLNEAKAIKLLTKLSEESRMHVYRKKQSIYMEGDQPSNVFMVKSGSVKTFMVAEDGREMTTGLYLPDQFFGYEAALLNNPEVGNAEALEPTELFIISRQVFDTLLFKNPVISNKFILLLSGRVQEKQDRLIKLAYNSVRKRIADALADLAERYAIENSDSCEMLISREDLAAMVGTTNETISRTLKDFKEEHLIEKTNGLINIISLNKLRSVKQ